MAEITPYQQRQLARGGLVAGGVYAARQLNRGLQLYRQLRAREFKRKLFGQAAEPAPKRAKVMSGGASHGIVRRSNKLGRKEPYASKMMKIQKAAERALVYVFRGINGLNAATGSNKGYFDMWQGIYSGANIPANFQRWPVDVYNLTAIPQGGVTTSKLDLPFDYANPQVSSNTDVIVPWVLGQDTVTNVAAWAYGRPGETNTTAAVPADTTRTWTPEKVTNQNLGAGTPVPVPGHSAYLDWIQARLMLYGRKKEESRITVRLVQFSEDHYCPEFPLQESNALVVGSDEQIRFQNVVQNFVKALVNNPISTKSNVTKQPFFKVLFGKTFVIPPKMTDDENDDPQKVQYDLFKRMNKLISYSVPTYAGENLADLNTDEFVAPSTAAFRAQPRRLRDNVYLMISSWDPRVTGVPSTDYQTTYDLNLRKRHTIELT